MQRALRIVTILIILLKAAVPVLAQDGGEEAFIAGLLPKLSPEAKVGQLFIVGFQGTEVSPGSEIAALIRDDQVGGVILSTGNGNISNKLDTIVQVAGLTARLQNFARATRTSTAAPFLPLFMALRQDGDGPPHSEILADLTPAPSYMALGATWNPANAQAIGQIVGQELSAIGVNLLLGPSLDVRTQPATAALDPGVNVLGGDPYWTGVMGDAYARGLQTGSAGRLAVTARHFPGQGSLNDASYTIDRSLGDLRKIDLPPFERLMLNPIEGGRPLADALLTTNARYRGFDGNIRERTAPLSLDGTALKTLLEQPEVTAWRDRGGLLISDAPGAVIVRDYYSATTSSGTISVTQAALDAFQAGNDMLLLDNLRPGDDAQVIHDVIAAFRQKYSTDPAFQQRVDSAVQRILRLKYRLYPNYDVTQVVVALAEVRAKMNTGEAAVAKVAQDAVTLLWPPDQVTPQQPGPADTLLIVVDTRRVQACPTCPFVQTLDPPDLARAFSQRYGLPTANITTTTYSELKAFVTFAANAPDLAPTFNAVQWVICAQQAISPDSPASDAVQLLIEQRADLLAGKRLIGFMFGPPHGFTTQQIERFTALYALYGKLATNVEAAVQALAAETLPGRSPVNILALDYDLTVQTEPDPAQTIPLAVGEAAVPGQPTPAPVTLRVGDKAVIRAGPLMDRNGHQVPDDTPVKFIFQYDGDPTPKVQAATARDGMARTEFVLDKVGRLLIRANSEPALGSTVLEITISASGGAVVATVVPTPTPTPTRIPTATPTSTLTPTTTPTPQLGPLEVFFTRKTKNAQWGELILALMGVAAIGGGGYWAARQRRDDLARALRAGLWCALGGLIGYVYFSLGLPGSELFRSILSGWAALLFVGVGGLLPLAYWLRQR
ncbi:Beta-hexosaminidase [Thermoflexales bacterium]|nr:Beta-hexosaminidase [Thermoflexales bacterium]